MMRGNRRIELGIAAQVFQADLVDALAVLVFRDRTAAPALLDGARDWRIDRDSLSIDPRDHAIERQLERLPLLGALRVARPRRDAVHRDEVNPLRVAHAPYDHRVANLESRRIVHAE